MYRIEEHDNETLLVAEPASEFGITYTYADYLKWRIEKRLELFRGRIYKMSAPNTQHQEISRNLFVAIAIFLEDKKCKVFSAPFDVRLPVQNKKRDNEVTTVVQPDICVVCDPEKIDKRGCIGSPDLIIEILSPGNSKKEVQNKFKLYEEAGVREYWIVSPAQPNIIIYTLTNGRFTGSKPFAPGEFITSTILPGLTINVEKIFEN